VTIAATRNLVIVHTPNAQALSDWEEVKSRIEASAPDIEVRIVDNRARNSVTRRWQVSRPSLVFSPCPLEEYRPAGGKIYAGRFMPKDQELQRMREAGLPVPETTLLTPDLNLSIGEWGECVVVKPDDGHGGIGVRVVRVEELPRRYAELTDGGRIRMLVQRYIDNNDADRHHVSYRVLTLFGREIYAGVSYWRGPRRSLDELADDPASMIIRKRADPDRHWELTFDEDVIGLARSVDRAFPESPVLGVDVVRDAGSGRLYAMECHPNGFVWHLSSWIFQQPHFSSLRHDTYRQFGALARTAELLIERTRAEAS
jgi:hypothetical protein